MIPLGPFEGIHWETFKASNPRWFWVGTILFVSLVLYGVINYAWRRWEQFRNGRRQKTLGRLLRGGR